MSERDISSATNDVVGSTDRESGDASLEEKRRAARRRFLVGGAASVPVVLTLGIERASAASYLTCLSLNNAKQVTTNKHNSYFCKPKGS